MSDHADTVEQKDRSARSKHCPSATSISSVERKPY